MLLIELFEEDRSLMGTPAKPLTPEKTKMCFPKKEVWRHVSAPGKKSGWKEVHIKTGKTNNTESAKENHSVKKIKPKYTRDTTPKGKSQQYRKYTRGTN